MLKLLKSKKAEKEFWAADTWPFHIIFGIILNTVFILFLLGLNSTAQAETKIPENLEEFTISSGFLFSENCFLYLDNDIARAYKLDFDKFNEENLDKCVEAKQAFKLTLKLDDEEKTIKTQNWDIDKESKKSLPVKHVTVFKDNNYVEADLFIELQRKK